MVFNWQLDHIIDRRKLEWWMESSLTVEACNISYNRWLEEHHVMSLEVLYQSDANVWSIWKLNIYDSNRHTIICWSKKYSLIKLYYKNILVYLRQTLFCWWNFIWFLLFTYIILEWRGGVVSLISLIYSTQFS